MAYQPRQQLYPPSGRIRSTSDPLSAAIAPPPDETPEERERRLRAEEEARRRSESIDRMLKEGERAQRRKKTVKVLLLGQSESGKSTTLKRESLYIPISPRSRVRCWQQDGKDPRSDAGCMLGGMSAVYVFRASLQRAGGTGRLCGGHDW